MKKTPDCDYISGCVRNSLARNDHDTDGVARSADHDRSGGLLGRLAIGLR
jgi:hypothetical protein